MIRVRQLLSSLNAVETAALKKLLPRGLASAVPAEPEGTRYPSALLGQLPKGESYSLAGHITEAMLRLEPAAITAQSLCDVAAEWHADVNPAKIIASKTTEPYLTHLRHTRIKMRAVAVGELLYDVAVAGDAVEGHPDARTATQIFEIKMTGQLKQNWVDFLFQTFSYAALAPEATDIYIVLPLQEIVWGYNVSSWPKRAEFRAFLEETAAKKSGAGRAAAMALIDAHCIGSHMSKARTLTATVATLPLDRPSQIFLSGPQTAQMRIADDDLVAAAAALGPRRLFIHSQYIINLCTPPGTQDDYHTALLIKNLEVARTLGAGGVVVHVGKSTTQTMEDALAHMRTNLTRAIAAASPACPILLETPAGQGTEVLRTWTEFAAFVAAFNDPRLRICIDTCHVFACGEDPHDYLRRFTDTHPAMTKLIHFNDSATPCGSCLDRHAFCGEGHIGLPAMTAIATAATAAAVPMVIE
jgi:deoxyribonuclease-4